MPKSGKSSFIKLSAKRITADYPETSETIKTVPSADQTRDVTLMARWLTKDFEIRAQDNQAIAALETTPEEIREDFSSHGIRFFEHAEEAIRGFCPLILRLYKGDKVSIQSQAVSGSDIDASHVMKMIDSQLSDLRV